MHPIRWLRVGASLFAAAAVVGCGDDTAAPVPDTGAPATTVEETPDIGGAPSVDADPDGVFRYGHELSELNFDPIRAATPAEFVHQHLIYGTLLKQEFDGSFVPELAEDVQIVDGRTIIVRLRPGQVFHDGTRLDAAAVKAGLERNVRAKVEPDGPGIGTAFRVELEQIDSIDVAGDLELRINLRSDAAGAVYALLATNEGMIVSPASLDDPSVDLNRRPVGAGPYRFVSYDPERSLKLERHDGYWNADQVLLAGVEFVHVASTAGAINALLTGQLDYVYGGSEPADAFRRPGIVVETTPSDNSMHWMPICKSETPFNDRRVRQALNLALDRDLINQLLFQGGGEPQVGVWTSSHIYYPEAAADLYRYDPVRASELLREAGVVDLSFDILTIGQSSIERFTEVVQQQWLDIGVTVNIVPAGDIVEQFFIRAESPLGAIPYTNRGITKLAGNFYPGSLANVCAYEDPELNAMIDELRAVPDGSPEAVELWKTAQEYVAEQALVIFGVFTPITTAHDAERVSGIEFRLDALGRPLVDLVGAYVLRG